MKSARLNKLDTSTTKALCSPAWLLRGISSIPGELRLNSSRISFIAHEAGSAWDWQLNKLERVAGSPGFMEALKGGSTAALFNEPLTDIHVRSPWYYFAGGLVLQVRDQSYRVSFGRPAGSSINGDELQTVSTMRRVGKRWLQALTSE